MTSTIAPTKNMTAQEIRERRFCAYDSKLYRLTLAPYCGGCREMAEGTYEQMRDKVAEILVRHWRERPINVLNRGWEWEVCESDDDGMVPTFCGILEISYLGPIESEWDNNDWLELADDATQEFFAED